MGDTDWEIEDEIEHGRQKMEDIEYEKENVIQRMNKGAGEWEIANERGWYGYWIIENGRQSMAGKVQGIENKIQRRR